MPFSLFSPISQKAAEVTIYPVLLMCEDGCKFSYSFHAETVDGLGHELQHQDEVHFLLLRALPIRLFLLLDSCWHSPGSGYVWYQSPRFKKTICSALKDGGLGGEWSLARNPAPGSDTLSRAANAVICFLNSLICAGACRDPATCNTNQGDLQRRFAPPSEGWWLRRRNVSDTNFSTRFRYTSSGCERGQITFFSPLICAGTRRNPATCGTHQVDLNRRSAPPLRDGG